MCAFSLDLLLLGFIGVGSWLRTGSYSWWAAYGLSTVWRLMQNRVLRAQGKIYLFA
jgi:hypothetical protein